MAANPYNAQDIALFRLMLQQQQQPPQFSPVQIRSNELGPALVEGLAQGAGNALNMYTQRRYQQAALEQLQGMMAQQQQAKEAERLRQQGALEQLANQFGINPAATADSDLLRQLIVKQEGNRFSDSQNDKDFGQQKELAVLNSQLGVAGAIDKETALSQLKQQMELAQRKQIADGISQFTGDNKIGDYYYLTGDTEPVKTLIGADQTAKLFRMYGQGDMSNNPGQQNFFRSVFGFQPTTGLDVEKQYTDLQGSRLGNEGKQTQNARDTINLNTENQNYQDFIKGIAARDKTVAGEMTPAQYGLTLLGTQAPGYDNLTKLNSAFGNKDTNALGAIEGLQKQNKNLINNQQDAANALRRQKGLVEQDQFPTGSLYTQGNFLTGDQEHFARPEALQDQPIAPFNPRFNFTTLQPGRNGVMQYDLNAPSGRVPIR